MSGIICTNHWHLYKTRPKYCLACGQTADGSITPASVSMVVLMNLIRFKRVWQHRETYEQRVFGDLTEVVNMPGEELYMWRLRLP